MSDIIEKSQPDNGTNTNLENKLYRPNCEEVIRCFNERDSEGLKKIINPKFVDATTIKNIEEAFTLINGDIISYKIRAATISSDSFRDGKVVYRYATQAIDDISINNSDRNFAVYINYTSADKEKPDYVGTSRIKVVMYKFGTKYSETRITIGEKLPD
ncbi:hypothetical protein FACS1894132_13640 [Clostridia bacterium]|nr:hypothetical protein FACS1894132_13640 [Clostridia bacterium]